MKRAFLTAAATAFLACSQSTMTPSMPQPVAGEPATMTTRDPHSFARPDEAIVNHLSLSLNVDFDRKVLDGIATLQIDNRKGVRELHLDARDLTIRSVTLGRERTPTTFSLAPPVEFLGSDLSIRIEPSTSLVNIEYSTSPEAAAVQWLAPEQTAGKRAPFLFTQSQAILARTWVPIQDTPGVRFTYEAAVRAPRGLLALMSAENTQAKNGDGVYRFRMAQRIPSYLLALAVGDLEFRPLGPRSGVYAEPPVIERAAWEFAGVERMMTAAEKLYGPYRWGRYDVLVLPPSFPFGGMENPRLTFATPTILAGDRSLVSLIAHELAHSWSGNLVTNATWNDFWLNEGFTNYFERRIMEEIEGREYSEMLSSLAAGDLRDTVDELGARSQDTHLFLALEGRDPDEGMNDIAYEKGYFFLRAIEEAAGRERFDAFLRRYFDRFAFQSMTTERFVEHLRSDLLRNDVQLESRIRLGEWIYGPGLPSNLPAVTSSRFARVDAEVDRFASGTAAASLDTANWSTQEWLHFLRALPKDTSSARLGELDARFQLSASGNSEVLTAWLLRSIDAGYTAVNPAVERFLLSMGRRKFLSPIYTALVKTPAGKEFAMSIYRRARPTYHAVSRGTIDEIVGWKN
jgi:leukotriene-A4 hydrolase